MMRALATSSSRPRNSPSPAVITRARKRSTELWCWLSSRWKNPCRKISTPEAAQALNRVANADPGMIGALMPMIGDHEHGHSLAYIGPDEIRELIDLALEARRYVVNRR